MLGMCNLTTVSKYYPDHLDTSILSWATEKPPVWKVTAMALDAVRGLRALHDAPGGPIVHFDLKPQQFLIDEDGRVKLNDLNMAKFMNTNASTGGPCPFETKHAAYPRRWRSPENMAGEVFLLEPGRIVTRSTDYICAKYWGRRETPHECIYSASTPSKPRCPLLGDYAYCAEYGAPSALPVHSMIKPHSCRMSIYS